MLISRIDGDIGYFHFDTIVECIVVSRRDTAAIAPIAADCNVHDQIHAIVERCEIGTACRFGRILIVARWKVSPYPDVFVEFRPVLHLTIWCANIEFHIFVVDMIAVFDTIRIELSGYV